LQYIRVNQGYPLSPTLFGIYIDKLEVCLEDASYDGITLLGIVIILLFCVVDIVVLKTCLFDLDKQLRILKDLCLSTGMTTNIEKKSYDN
jgi:hypothetical protein